MSTTAQGETGSFFASATDIQSMADIAAYIRADPGSGTPHVPLQVPPLAQRACSVHAHKAAFVGAVP